MTCRGLSSSTTALHNMDTSDVMLQGGTPLHIACHNAGFGARPSGHLFLLSSQDRPECCDMVKCLLSHGAHVDSIAEVCTCCLEVPA